jgi:hypothetical protein
VSGQSCPIGTSRLRTAIRHLAVQIGDYGLWAEDLAVTEHEPHFLRSAGAVPPTCAEQFATYIPPDQASPQILADASGITGQG